MPIPSSRVQHPGPQRGLATYWFGRGWMRVFGWTVAGELPQVPQAILIAAPHTSNWDLAHMLATSYVCRLRLSWLGKHTLFKPPWGPFMRFLGGVPVDRRAAHGLVKQVVDHFAREPQLIVVVPPEGTRGRASGWKSGFYWMACEAKVPIICGYLDYRTKTAGFGLVIHPTGDVAADMDRIREFYAPIQAKFPSEISEMILKEERTPHLVVASRPG